MKSSAIRGVGGSRFHLSNKCPDDAGLWMMSLPVAKFSVVSNFRPKGNYKRPSRGCVSQAILCAFSTVIGLSGLTKSGSMFDLQFCGENAFSHSDY